MSQLVSAISLLFHFGNVLLSAPPSPKTLSNLLKCPISRALPQDPPNQGSRSWSSLLVSPREHSQQEALRSGNCLNGPHLHSVSVVKSTLNSVKVTNISSENDSGKGGRGEGSPRGNYLILSQELSHFGLVDF